MDVRRLFPGIAPLLSLLLLSVRLAVAAPLTYSNDFSGAIGAEWSNTATSSTPVGARKFLGEFGKQTVTLALTGAPTNSTVKLSFDLFLISSWDGNNADFGINGPDIFRVSIDGGPTLLNSTFSNVYYFGGFNQSYPNAAGAGDFAPFTGAAESKTLGYFEPGGTFPADAVYHFVFEFPHAGPDLNIQFISLQSEAISNERWGLDNVSVAAVPEPEALGLAAMGAAVVAVWFAKRQRRRSPQWAA